jgi:hypothetical protein
METKTEKPKSKAQIKRDEEAEAIDSLRRWMPKGTRVYTILRHVSASGMSRDISIVVFPEGEKYPIHPNYSAAKAMGWQLVTRNGSDAIRVGGCGMDMGFHLVHSISQKLYGWDKDGKYNHEGAYSLKQEWL